MCAIYLDDDHIVLPDGMRERLLQSQSQSQLASGATPLPREPGTTFEVGAALGDLVWTSPVPTSRRTASASAAHLLSVDRMGELVLESHRRFFTVSFPLRIGERIQSVNPRTLQPIRIYTYVQHRQIFPCAACPPRWSGALALLWASLDAQSTAPSLSSPAHAFTPLPVARFSSDLPPDHVSLTPSLQLHALAHAMPPANSVRIEVCDACVHWVWPERNVVETLVTLDESFLVRQANGMFHHFVRRERGVVGGDGDDGDDCDGDDGGHDVYALDAVPTTVWFRTGGDSSTSSRYDLHAVAEHAEKLLQHASQMHAHEAAAASAAAATTTKTLLAQSRIGETDTDSVVGVASDGAAVSCSACASLPRSARVHDRVVVPNRGTFTAFADGAVRVQFIDRTMIDVAPCGQHARVLQRNGVTVHVPVSEDDAIERDDDDGGHAHSSSYLHAALDYRRWAYLTHEQRLALHAAQEARSAAAHAQIDAIQRCLQVFRPSSPPS